MFTYVKHLTTITLCLLFVGCYNTFGNMSEGDEQLPVANMTIEELHALCAADEYFDVSQDVAIRGTVTANDEGGNFYLSFVIEQDGYAVEVLEGLNYTYVRYPVGSVVTISLNGLRLSRSYGVMQVGIATSSGSYYDLDYLGHEYIIDQHITNSGVGEQVTPLALTLEELYEGSYESMCGRLVSISGVRFKSEDYEVDELVWSGSKCFVDSAERELGCYTSEYAYYSMVAIEEGYATMTGVLEYGTLSSSSIPFISMRTQDDYQLDPAL